MDIDNRENGMCFTTEEKTEFFERLRRVEIKADEHETTVRVTLAVGGVFMVLLVSIAVWYLSQREDEIGEIGAELNRMNGTLIRMETGQEIYQEAFSAHLADPDNHPDNTERVNALREDFRDLSREVEELKDNH